MKNLVIAALTVAACSSTPVTNLPVDAGGNPDTSTSNSATYNGVCGQFGAPTTPVGGVTITALPANLTATSDATTGKYSLSLTKATPFSLSYKKAITIIEQEETMSGDTVNATPTQIVDGPTENLLLGSLIGYDKTLAVLSVTVYKSGTCATADGATVALSPVGSEKVVYFKSGFPSSTQTTVIDGQIPSVIFYNVTPGQKIALTITHPTCKQAAFPFTDPDMPTISYTGNVTTVPADPSSSAPTASYARFYLQ
jgi:hypothetical protein